MLFAQLVEARLIAAAGGDMPARPGRCQRCGAADTRASACDQKFLHAAISSFKLIAFL
jgi:hypothetical protein